MSGDPDRTGCLAEHLKQLNDARKKMTLDYTEEALRLLEGQYAGDDIKVIYLPECHESIAGIIAGRVREASNHPCIILTDCRAVETEVPMIKGSGRSIPSYNMFAGLCSVSHLLARFGGQKMAAGMSLKRSDLEEFRRQLNTGSGLTAENFREKIWIDGRLQFEEVTERLVAELERLEPFGNGNEKPLFGLSRVDVLSARALGRNNNVAKLRVRSETGAVMDAVAFTDADAFLEELAQCRRIDILFYPQINEYMGTRSPQIVIKEWRRA